MITSIILLIFLFIVILNTIYSIKYGVVNMPSTFKTRNIIADDIASINSINLETMVIYDCGSGWGGLCQTLAKRFPDALIKGFEISPIPYFISKINPFRRYKVTRNDLFKADLSEAKILIFYLSPNHMKKIKDEILPTLKPGTLIYSQGFPIPDMKADKIFKTSFAIEKECYRYDL